VTRRGAADDDTRPLSDLLVEQVELANVVLLNKTDLVSPAELETVEELVHGLRPDAEIVRTEYSTVDPDRLLGRRLYDPARAVEAAGWRQALAEAAEEEGADHHDHSHGDDHDHHDHSHGDDHDHHDHSHGDDHDHHDHSHPEEAYGVTSFVYRRRRPFHADRIASVLADLPPNVVRSKGTLWVAGSEQHLTLGQAGPSVHAEAAGPWVATRPEFEQDAYRRNRSDLTWDERWGDRRTELVFIGTEFDEASLVARLDDCLLDDDEFAAFEPETWEAGDDPLPTAQGERVVLAAPDVE
jgi:G3E family GTPase